MMKLKIKNQKKSMLNIGCGKNYRKNWINLDLHSKKAEVIHDLNKFPYPFKDNTFEHILAAGIMEHLDNPLKTMKELWRISKPNGTIMIKVPYFTSYTAWVDITHKRPFTYNSFSRLCGFYDSKIKGTVLYQPILFEYRFRRLIWGTTSKSFFKPITNFMNWLVNLNPEFMEKRIPFLIPIQSLYVNLIVKK